MIKKLINYFFPNKNSQEYRFKIFQKYNKKNCKELNEYFKNKYQDERLLVFHLDILSKAAFNFSFYDTYVTNEEMENVFKFYNFDDFSKKYLNNLVNEINKTRKRLK